MNTRALRILVTGGTGFIGRHVAAAAIRRGHNVRVAARSPASGASAGGVRHVSVDLRDGSGLAEALRDIDVVVHCAAAMGGDREHQTAVTVDGTERLLSAMTNAGAPRIISLSSFAVYDMAALQEGALLDESAPLETRPALRAPYIGAKIEQEALVRSNGSMDWTILRPGLVFGRGRTWFHHLGVQLTPRQWLCLSPAAVLPLTHVENCADAIMTAVESGEASGATLNVVDDHLPSRREYMGALAELHQPTPAIHTVPWSVLRTTAAMSDKVSRHVFRGRAPVPDLLRPAALHSRCKPLRYGNARLRDLGWQPAVTWREGLRTAFE